MRRGTAHLQLAIELDSDPITGSVSDGGQSAQPFTGWIELVAAIETARAASDGAEAWRPKGDVTVKTLGSLPGAKALIE
jgi:hypothetical protein